MTTMKFSAKTAYNEQGGYMLINDGDYQLSLRAETESIIRVRYGMLDECRRPAYHLVDPNRRVGVQCDETVHMVSLSTRKIRAVYAKDTGRLTFRDNRTGKVLLSETLRNLIPVERYGEKSYSIEQGFETFPDEFISGTGYQQDDLVDYNGRYAYLCQWNTSSFIPFIQSNRGWAILWNNTSLTELNPDPMFLSIKPTASAEAACKFTAMETGRYYFSLHRKTKERFGKLQFSVDDKILLSKRPAWDPMVFTASIDLVKGETYTIRATGNFEISYQPPASAKELVLRSEMGQLLDYHFIAGITADERIAGYRELTGRAPLFPRWAYGFFQSRERYRSGDELVETVKEFRRRKFPMDCIVQDWEYWGKHGWNAVCFDHETFPQMDETVDEIHGMNARLMISVWPNFGDPDEGSQSMLNEFGKKGWLLERNPRTAAYGPAPCEQFKKFWSGYIDVMNSEAGEALWDRINRNLFLIGLDAWWLDATEPNLDGYQGGMRNYPTSQGAGAYWLNLYPMMHSRNIHKGQRSQSSKKRVFILGRTGFAGIQRYGTTVWSGDTWSDWDTFRRQIAAGITTSYSGIPYWCADIGGFSGLDNNDPAHREMYTRWFQFGAFSPIFRAHGTSCSREPWCFGEESEAVQLKYLRLRYRLLPYIYSEAGEITNNNSTMMRGLLMDFPDDRRACRSKGSYMFGKAFLVSPITESKEDHRKGEILHGDILLDSSGIPGGLSSAYYNGTSFNDLIQKSKDARMVFSWDESGMEHLEFKVDGTIEGLKSDHFSARWEGFVRTDEPGDYEFTVTSDDGVRLWINDEMVIDDWKQQDVKINSAKVAIKKSGPVPFRLECFKDRDKGSLELRRKALGEDRQDDFFWPVYLPEGANWYNFWSGECFSGGQIVETEAPLDLLPLYVKAGSIIPMGPQQEWTDQKPADALEIRIFPRADGSFTLYEDEGDNYNYEEGRFSRIGFQWNDRQRKLTIKAREGCFHKMPQTRTFKFLLVGKGDKASQVIADQVSYFGAETVVKL